MMHSMKTVTIPQKKYEIVEKQAELYRLFVGETRNFFPIELYSASRLKEFFQEDRVNSRLKKKVGKILQNS